MSINAYSTTDSDASEGAENTYCIFLHIVEGIGFNGRDKITDIVDQRKSKILLHASLNGVKFEMEGNSLSSEKSTIFNTNCIWECELCDIKRMKTDNRPIKIECFLKSGLSEQAQHKTIGSLLLPLRGVQVLSNLTNTSLKLHWHKLGALNADWRHNKPEIYLMLLILKKTVLESGQLETLLGKRKHKPATSAVSNCEVMLSPNISETAYMLQSQNNVYVQLLEQVGLIQVGNNPDVDCDVFSVTLTFKQVKNVIKLLEMEQNAEHHSCNVFIFHYDFLGSNSHVEVQVSPTDSYTINEKITLTFKSSIRSLRSYFQRIFYVPVNLCYQGRPIANYRFDFSKYLPDDEYFGMHKIWTKNGFFYFDRLHKILSPKSNKPTVDFIFTIQLLTSYAKRSNYTTGSASELSANYRSIESNEGCRIVDISQVESSSSKRPPFQYSPVSGPSRRSLELYDRCHKEHAAESVHTFSDRDDLCAKSMSEFAKEVLLEREEAIFSRLQHLMPKHTVTVGIETDKDVRRMACTVGVNTEPTTIFDQEELYVKIVEELEEWKHQQMNRFLNELSRKEKNYLMEMQHHWEQQRTILQARLESKIDKCEQLSAQLERTQSELITSQSRNNENLNIAESIKREIEQSYTKKFLELDTEMQRLKIDMQERGSIFEIKNKEVQIENTRLEREKMELKDRVEQLQKELNKIQSTYFSPEKLNEVLSDLRKQNEQFASIEKSRNYYKQQWAKVSHEVNRMKMKFLKMKEQNLPRKNRQLKPSNDFELHIEEILNEEKEHLKTDRSELNSIKNALLSSSESSFEDDDIDEDDGNGNDDDDDEDDDDDDDDEGGGGDGGSNSIDDIDDVDDETTTA